MKKRFPSISLFREGRLVAQTFAKRKSVFTGCDWRADLTDPQGTRSRNVLLERRFSRYRLVLPEGTTATFRKGTSRMTLDEMVLWGQAKRTRKGYIVPIDESMSAEFSIESAKYRLSYEVCVQHAVSTEHAITGSVPFRYRFPGFSGPDIVFTGIILLVMAAQLLALYGMARYPVPEIITLKDLPRRISRLILEPASVPEKVRTAAAPAAEKAIEEKVPDEVPEPVIDKPVTFAKELPVGREAVRKKVSRVGVLGVLTGRGTAGRAIESSGLSALQLGSVLEKSLDEVLSEVSGITVAQADEGDGFADGTGTGAGLLDLESVIDSEGIGGPVKVSKLGVTSGSGTGKSIESKSGELKPEERKERSTRAISRVVAAHTGAIRYAYNRELRKNPALRGKIVLRFTISPGGEVTECSVEETAMKWQPLEDTLVKMVLKWKFPAIPEGTVTVRYPFVFFQSM